ncbi:MAG: hypothetical protein R3A52_29165 [Polyangiales bacterium]
MPSMSLRALFALALVYGCASRGGYAEPGPASPSANPPSPASLQSGQPLQPSPGNGRDSPVPPTVGPGGNAIPTEGNGGSASGQECASDADCVPAQCCHPNACTARAQRPNCAAVMCTMMCAPDTLDCNQGRCVCVGGRCGVQRSG